MACIVLDKVSSVILIFVLLYTMTFVFWLLLRFYHWLSLVPSIWFCLVLIELLRSVNQIVFKFLSPLPPFWVLNYICVELLILFYRSLIFLFLLFLPVFLLTVSFWIDLIAMSSSYCFLVFLVFCFVVSNMFSISPYDSFISDIVLSLDVLVRLLLLLLLLSSYTL